MIAANTSFHINQPFVDAQKAQASLVPFVPDYPPPRQEKTISPEKSFMTFVPVSSLFNLETKKTLNSRRKI